MDDATVVMATRQTRNREADKIQGAAGLIADLVGPLRQDSEPMFGAQATLSTIEDLTDAAERIARVSASVVSSLLARAATMAREAALGLTAKAGR